MTTGASALKGTKLTIIGGNSYVPAQDGELDDLVKQLSADTGMDAKVERYADAQMDAKVAAVIESGGADVAVLRDTDPHLYGNKLLDVTDIANELDAAWGGWYDVAKQAGIVNGQWRALMLGQAPAAWNWRPDFFSAAGVSKFPDTFDELLAAAQKMHDYGKPIGMTPRPRARRRQVDELPGAVGLRRQGVRGRRQNRRAELARDAQRDQVVHRDVQVHGSGRDRLGRSPTTTRRF